VIVLSIATFTLSMSGTFLVRSGILNSIHTFANDPGRGIFILVFLFILIFISLVIFFSFNKKNHSKNIKIYWLSKESSILINNWFMMYFLSVILIGTVYPIFLEVLSSEKISVGPPFYHKLIIPFLIIFLIFMSVGPNLNWIKSEFKKIDKKNIIIFIISLAISFLIIIENDSKSLINTILISSAFYLFFVTVKDFFSKKYKNYSQKISHLGFSLLILSILLNNFFSSEIITNLKVGEKFSFQENHITFETIENKESKNYKSIIGHFRIEDKQGSLIKLKPELRIYDYPFTITSEADIKTTIYSDKFLVMNLVKGNEYFNIRYQLKPFMIWIWISTLIIAIGGIFSLFNKTYEK